MDQIRMVMGQMIDIDEESLSEFLNLSTIKTWRKNEVVSRPDLVPADIFFINRGLIRVFITGMDGVEHTVHFALENQFIADYSNFIRKKPAVYTLQALEETEVVVLPRKAIEWGYKHMTNGQELGRLIAEYYFIYQDERIQNQYVRTPKQRYDSITDVFPNLHNRVPQHMIASYLGITPIHLSRLKKSRLDKL
jgi:CRP-like cAMP-binding protein